MLNIVAKDGKQKASPLLKQKKRILNIWCWIFMLPATILYILFQGYPIVASIWYSMLKWTGMSSKAKFVGLDNFKKLLSDELFFNAVKNTFLYMLGVVPLLLILSLALAYIFNSIIKKYVALFRTIFFIPVITTTSIVGIIMIFIFGGSGAINQFLGMLSIQGVNWIGSKEFALLTVILVGVWKDVGTYMIYWLAALQSVPRDVYEAAEIDGANRWQLFKNVVFPMILPMGAVIGVLCVISSFKVFDLVQTMTNSGPFYASDVVSTFVYRTAYASSNGMPQLGYASAAALVFGVIVILIGVIGNAVKGIFLSKE